MSLGTPRVTLRLSEQLQAEIQAEIDLQDRAGLRERETLTDWITRAILERLAKRRRSRGHRRPRVQRSADGWPLQIIDLVDRQEGGE